MMNNWKQNYFAFFLLFMAVVLDGFILSNWMPNLNTDIGLMIPRMIILIITILSFYYSRVFMLGSAAFFGFLMDAYYLGFTGVYMASLLLVSYLIINLRYVIKPNIISYFLVSILSISIVEVIVYGIMKALKITSVPFQVFITTRLGATLLFNGALMLLFGYFIQKMIVNIIEKY